MNINIENIGVICDSSIEVNGLTVITGQNNSGKTTVGKVLYSLFSSKENLYENATADIIKFSKRQITNMIRNSGLAFFLRQHRTNIVKQESEDDILLEVYKGEYPPMKSIEDVQNFILFLCNYIQDLKLEDITEGKSKKTFLFPKYQNKDEFRNEMSEITEQLQRLIKKIAQLSDFDFYERTKILKTMSAEFKNQIAPVRLPENYVSSVTLSEENNCFRVKIDNKTKKISTDGYFGFKDIGNVIFIDDVTVIDSVTPSFYNIYIGYHDSYHENELSDVIRTLDHKYSLIYKLSSTNDIVESIIDNEIFEKINNQITNILNDDIVVRDGSFVCAAGNLNLANLAMGSKMFAILRMLLSNGSINEKTLLILDEPEAHLHPLWQNMLAEIIILLIKGLGVKIVITSHSPNFILALQTFATKHNVTPNCNFYSTQKRSDGYIVDYHIMNNELSKIYADFAKPFSQIKAMFDSIKYGENND